LLIGGAPLPFFLLVSGPLYSVMGFFGPAFCHYKHCSSSVPPRVPFVSTVFFLAFSPGHHCVLVVVGVRSTPLNPPQALIPPSPIPHPQRFMMLGVSTRSSLNFFFFFFQSPSFVRFIFLFVTYIRVWGRPSAVFLHILCAACIHFPLLVLSVSLIFPTGLLFHLCFLTFCVLRTRSLLLTLWIGNFFCADPDAPAYLFMILSKNRNLSPPPRVLLDWCYLFFFNWTMLRFFCCSLSPQFCLHFFCKLVLPNPCGFSPPLFVSFFPHFFAPRRIKTPHVFFTGVLPRRWAPPPLPPLRPPQIFFFRFAVGRQQHRGKCPPHAAPVGVLALVGFFFRIKTQRF